MISELVGLDSSLVTNEQTNEFVQPMYSLLLLLFNGSPAHVGPRFPLMRFRNLTLIDNW
jgi:hypothetical protein